MKKSILLIGLVLLLGLVSCSDGNNTSESQNNENEMNEEMKENNNQMNNEDNMNKEDNMNNEVEATEDEATEDEEMAKVFNKESLAEFNGKDGKPGYVAVNGVVYDVSDVAAWQTPHAGRFEPGKDYSTEIGQSPHGLKNLENLEVVGTYED